MVMLIIITIKIILIALFIALSNMQLYIENSTARTILLKPVLHEFDQTRRKLVTNIIDRIVVMMMIVMMMMMMM